MLSSHTAHSRLAALFLGIAAVTLMTWNSSHREAGAQETTSTPEQNNQVNVVTNQTTIVVLPSPRPEEPQAIIFFTTDDREVIKPGETLTYRAVIKNPRADDLNDIRVTAHIPDYLIPIETSPAAEANPEARTLTWNKQIISARSEVTFAFRTQVAAEAPAGTVIRTTSEINGPGVRASATDATLVEGGPAATTTAPAAVATPTSTARPAAAPVVPTARTGAGSSLLIASLALLTGLMGSGMLYQRRA